MQDTIQQIIVLVVLIITAVMMSRANKKVTIGQVSQEPLTKKEKIIIWILCILNPLIAGGIFYYGWKKKLPVKAKQANQISLWAFLIVLALIAAIVFLPFIVK